jgi:phosphatidylglycerol lysyltransferase
MAGSLHLKNILAAAAIIAPASLWLAGLLAVGSYLLLCHVDTLAVRYAGRPVRYRRTLFVGFIANAIGHNLSLPALTAAAIRLRLYSAAGLTTPDVAKVSAFASLTSGLGIATLFGCSVLLSPQAAARQLHVHPTWTVVAGAAALLAVAAYLWLASHRGRFIELHGWSIQAPGARLAWPQWLLGSADLALTAAVLWALLPGGLPMSFVSFAGLFAVAVAAGLVSHVPGGLGVFDTVIVLAVPGASPEVLVGALLVYRAIYYLVPLMLAVLLFAVRELMLVRVSAVRPPSRALAFIAPLSPLIAGSAVYIAGCVLLISGATPALDARLQWLRGVLPLPVLELSHLVGSCVGLALLLLARGLTRRARAAWHLTMILLVAGMVASLLKGLDFEEASFLGGVMFVLYAGRHAYYRPSALLQDPFSPLWVASVGAVLAVATWVGWLAHRHVDYSSELWWTFAFSGNTPRMLRASMITALLAAAFIVINLMRARPPVPTLPTAADLETAARAVAADPQSVGNAAMTGDKRLLFNAQRDAFVMYQVRGRSWIALGDPVGPQARHEELLWSFRELVDRHGGWTVFYEVAGANLPQYIDLGLAALKLGEEACVALPDFSLEGPHRADLRQTWNRAERAGSSFEIVHPAQLPALLPRLKDISDAWLHDKAVAEKGFSVGSFDERYLQRFPIALVRVAGDPVAFANLWPSANGYELSVDLMRFGPDAPRGAMDYLIIELLLWGREQGYQWFNLGMAPLAGLEHHPLAPVWHRVGNFLFRHG